jgi:hypothetical protein
LSRLEEKINRETGGRTFKNSEEFSSCTNSSTGEVGKYHFVPNELFLHLPLLIDETGTSHSQEKTQPVLILKKKRKTGSHSQAFRVLNSSGHEAIKFLRNHLVTYK